MEDLRLAASAALDGRAVRACGRFERRRPWDPAERDAWFTDRLAARAADALARRPPLPDDVVLAVLTDDVAALEPRPGGDGLDPVAEWPRGRIGARVAEPVAADDPRLSLVLTWPGRGASVELLAEAAPGPRAVARLLEADEREARAAGAAPDAPVAVPEDDEDRPPAWARAVVAPAVKARAATQRIADAATRAREQLQLAAERERERQERLREARARGAHEAPPAGETRPALPPGPPVEPGPEGDPGVVADAPAPRERPARPRHRDVPAAPAARPALRSLRRHERADEPQPEAPSPAAGAPDTRRPAAPRPSAPAEAAPSAELGRRRPPPAPPLPPGAPAVGEAGVLAFCGSRLPAEEDLRSEAGELVGALEPGEGVFEVARAHLGVGVRGLLALTDRRLLFARTRRADEVRVLAIPRADVTKAAGKAGRMGASVKVDVPGERFEWLNVAPKAAAPAIAAHLRAEIARRRG